jgi:hypothetical protein
MALDVNGLFSNKPRILQTSTKLQLNFHLTSNQRMPHINEFILKIQIMELLQNTINDTLQELENDISPATKQKLQIAQNSLSTEILMNSLRGKFYSQHNTNEENQL